MNYVVFCVQNRLLSLLFILGKAGIILRQKVLMETKKG